jgi:hypothetical protein
MMSSGMLCHVALVRTNVSEEFTRATRRNIPEDTILPTGIKSIPLATDRDQRMALVNMVLRVHVPHNVGKFCHSWKLAASQKDSVTWR